ncbi:MAG: hypothetical protein LH650_05030 [Chloroflexi bacterium]|nr:hypothetical protein [Chloroflexota bacterium]
MHAIRTARWALPIALLASVAVTAPAMADFGPTRTVRTTSPGTDLDVTDYAWDNGTVALTWEEDQPAGRRVYLGWSTDRGTTWHRQRVDDRTSRDPQVAACAGWVWAIDRLRVTGAPAHEWLVALSGRSTSTPEFESSVLTTSGEAREPDLACVGTRRLAAAWFQKSGDTWRVKVRSRAVIPQPKGDEPPAQSFDLGTGDLYAGLAIAATKDMVYVAWFQGDTLKVRRFTVGAGPDYLLSNLETVSVATLPYASSVELGAQGLRVVLAYSQNSDVKVRTSTTLGSAFGSARTIRNNSDEGFVSARPTTVGVKGDRLVVGVVEYFGDIGLTGSGFGYLSTNGGTSWTRKPSHSRGLVVAGLVKVGTGYRYAEAWDQSIYDEGDSPSVERLRYRRE